MIYHGRAGLWDDWLKFQKEAKQRREAEERAAFRKRAARRAKLWLTLMWGAIVALMGLLALMGVWVLDQLKGK
jgi:cell division septal protein FtsQ